MSYLDSRIIILNSVHGRLLNGTYKSNVEFSFQGLLTQQDDIEQIQIISLCTNSCIILYYKLY